MVIILIVGVVVVAFAVRLYFVVAGQDWGGEGEENKK